LSSSFTLFSWSNLFTQHQIEDRRRDIGLFSFVFGELYLPREDLEGLFLRYDLDFQPEGEIFDL
jgi:hypothetical protein